MVCGSVSYADHGAAYVLRSQRIRMPTISNRHWPEYQSTLWVDPSSPWPVRQAAECLARQYHGESHFNLPYTAGDDNYSMAVLLLKAWQVDIAYTIPVGGAIGFSLPSAEDPTPWISWAYVHPYQRARRLIDSARPSIIQRFPEVRFRRPFTPAGAGMVRRLTNGKDGADETWRPPRGY